MQPTLTCLLAAAALFLSTGKALSQAPAQLTLAVLAESEGGFGSWTSFVALKTDEPAIKFEISGPAGSFGTWACVMARAYLATDDPGKQPFVDGFTAQHGFMALPPTPTFEELGLPGAEGSLPEVGAETLAQTLAMALYPATPDRVRDSHQPLLPSADPAGWPVRVWGSGYPYWNAIWAQWWKDCLLAKPGETGDGGIPDQDAVFDINRLAMAVCDFQAQASGSNTWSIDAYWEAVASGTLKFKIQVLGLRSETPGAASTWPTDDSQIPPGIPGWPGEPPRIKLSNPVTASLTLREISAPVPGWLLAPYFVLLPGSSTSQASTKVLRAAGLCHPATARLRFADGISTIVNLGHAGPGLASIAIPAGAPPGMCTITRFTNPAGTSAFGGQGWNQFPISP